MIRAELNQTILRGGQRLPLDVLNRTLKAVNRACPQKRDVNISMAFVDVKTMKRLNRAYRGKDGLTDVLSFTLDDQDQLGELVISYDQARKQAKDLKHSVRDEIVFLIVHGLLHLFGHDHETPGEAKKMFALQERILRSLDVNPQV